MHFGDDLLVSGPVLRVAFAFGFREFAAQGGDGAMCFGVALVLGRHDPLPLAQLHETDDTGRHNRTRTLAYTLLLRRLGLVETAHERHALHDGPLFHARLGGRDGGSLMAGQSRDHGIRQGGISSALDLLPWGLVRHIGGHRDRFSSEGTAAYVSGCHCHTTGWKVSATRWRSPWRSSSRTRPCTADIGTRSRSLRVLML